METSRDHSRDEDRPFRPRLGDRRAPIPLQRAPRFCRAVLIRAQLRFTAAAGLRGRASSRHPTRAVADVQRPLAQSRRCIVKARVVPMTAHGLKAARLHLAYIERDGVEADGSRGRLYGDGDTVDRAVLTAPIPGERHQFRFIVSPEDGVDLTIVVRKWMGQVEKDLGVPLRWAAVNHHDTEHPHAHVVVRGIDGHGKQVFIDRAYIANQMRWQAQHILTEELGPRLPHDIERQLDREVGQERLTTLDRRLATMLGPHGTLERTALGAVRDPNQRKRLVGRLRLLETLQLAARTSKTSWHLADGWQEALRELGERDDVIKKVHRALGKERESWRDPPEVIDGKTDHPPVEGVVRTRGLHDELRGDGYLIVETGRGTPVYARLDLATVEAIPDQSVVRIAVERQSWVKPMDRVLEQVARENGGLYDPVQHQRALAERLREDGFSGGPRDRPALRAVDGQWVSAEAIVAANLRRLVRLERHRLVARRADGSWRVPGDLVKTLQEREVTHPRRLVRVQPVAPPLDRQIVLRGPAWLDRQAPHGLGLGTALARALAARVAFLTRLGIRQEPAEEKLCALRELERADCARHLGRQLGLMSVSPPPVGMRGRLTVQGRGAAGTPFACLIDDDHKRLAVFALTPASRVLAGQHVTVSRDSAGRLHVRTDDRGRGA